jgi:hypothetical protein
MPNEFFFSKLLQVLTVILLPWVPLFSPKAFSNAPPWLVFLASTFAKIIYVILNSGFAARQRMRMLQLTKSASHCFWKKS